MARDQGLEIRSGVTLGDVRRWLEEVNLPDSAILTGRVSFRGVVTRLSAREDRLKNDQAG